ncbi:MAG: hypothetical protein LBR39_02375 [Coriobacteriales bacterium]|jgi:predicted amidophosphoribosyltransferase|nr:hypothetical protein [Coriobacteriales bacterium]
MSIACTDCFRCGKCYPKDASCPTCQGPINYERDEACPACGNPITDTMKQTARQLFMEMKRQEREQMFPAFKKKRDSRMSWLKGNTNNN